MSSTQGRVKLKQPIESLAGIKGDTLVAVNGQINVTGTFTTTGIAPNPNRVSCIIQNLGTNVISVSLGPGFTAIGVLTQYGTYTVDKLNPWSGHIGVSGLNPNAGYTELSVY